MRREFNVRRQILVFSLNNLKIPPTQINKLKKDELAFALFRSEVFVLLLGALVSTIFVVVGILYCFLRIFWKTKVDLNKMNIPRLLTHHGVSLSEI